jgi:hypothetical protein
MCAAQSSNSPDGTMTSATPASQDARAKRSNVQAFHALKTLPDYEYPRLSSMQRRIRLLKLTGGSLDNPEITCKLFEVEFGDDSVVREVNGLEENKEGSVVEYEALSWCWGNEGREIGIRMIGTDGVACRFPVTRELGVSRLPVLRSSGC